MPIDNNRLEQFLATGELEPDLKPIEISDNYYKAQISARAAIIRQAIIQEAAQNPIIKYKDEDLFDKLANLLNS